LKKKQGKEPSALYTSFDRRHTTAAAKLANRCGEL
jgi:hypothetical protein